MAKFSLEIESWGSWDLEKKFKDVQSAINYGLENLTQNEWRIKESRTSNVVYRHDPFTVIEQEARGEIDRFNTTEQWRERYAQRQAQEIANVQAMQRATRIASRRIDRMSREQQNQRRERLNGFGFVGDAPRIYPIYEDFSDIFGTSYDREVGIDNKVNWLKEGF
jgi:serine phosphatase RsbU (regulator of sigma subunit)